MDYYSLRIGFETSLFARACWLCRALHSAQSAGVRRRRSLARRLIHADIWTALDDTGRLSIVQKASVTLAFWTAWTAWTALSFFRKRDSIEQEMPSAAAHVRRA